MSIFRVRSITIYALIRVLLLTVERNVTQIIAFTRLGIYYPVPLRYSAWQFVGGIDPFIAPWLRLRPSSPDRLGQLQGICW